MAKKKVFISFDYDHDKRYKYLLEAWDANTDFDFSINDTTPEEIQSQSVSVVKQVLSRKISESTYTIVLIGKYANSEHPDKNEIGYENWQNFEVAKSKEHSNNMVGVKLSSENDAPEELYGSGAKWANFTQDSIIDALNSF